MAMLYRTNLGHCGGETLMFTPMCDRQYHKQAALCELVETTVLSVKMNRERLVGVAE